MAPTSSLDSRASRGAAAEAKAANFLATKNLAILARNIRCRFGEIDIVARDGEVLVFVEVRLRESETFGGAMASVDARKQQRIAATARWYLGRYPKSANMPCRFDVVGVAASGEAVTWLRDAFRVDG